MASKSSIPTEVVAALRRYHRDPAMPRQILFYLLALALLYASPGFHWHDHPHDAGQVVVSAGAHDQDTHPDSTDGEESRCTECLLQALQAAPAGDGSLAPGLALRAG